MKFHISSWNLYIESGVIIIGTHCMFWTMLDTTVKGIVETKLTLYGY